MGHCPGQTNRQPRVCAGPELQASPIPRGFWSSREGGAGSKGRLSCCTHCSSWGPWTSAFWGPTPCLATTQSYRLTLQVGGLPSLFPQNTAPLQKQPGVCRVQVRPSGGAMSPTWDSLPTGAVITRTARQNPRPLRPSLDSSMSDGMPGAPSALGVLAGPRDPQWVRGPAELAHWEVLLPPELQSQPGSPPACPRTFSLWMSLLIWEILIFMASSSSSSTRGMLGAASDSSTVWKLRSVSGIYHLQSYCWVLLGGGGGTLTGCPPSSP